MTQHSDFTQQIQTLEQSFEASQDKLSASNSLRVYRALSWLKASALYEFEAEPADIDTQLIHLSIALRALMLSPEQLDDFTGFAGYIVAQDSQRTLYQLLWQEYSPSIRQMIKNPFLYSGFWQAQRDSSAKAQWQKGFDEESVAALNAMSRKREVDVLSIVFSRLAVLQEQVLAGGASFQSQVNRVQVQDGLALLKLFVPYFMQIMLQADEPWAEVAYPVIKKVEQP